MRQTRFGQGHPGGSANLYPGPRQPARLARAVVLALVLPALTAPIANSAGESQLRHNAPIEDLVLRLSDDTTLKLVRIPAGKFQMGSPDTDRRQRRDGRESPRKEVTVSRDFYMGIHEVTRAQFATFVNDSNYLTQAEREGWTFAWNGITWDKVKGASWRKPGIEQTDRHPVICVSFDDAVTFCAWLSGKTGKAVRLPTEAQWEYACRAGTTNIYPWGDDPDGGNGWANAADQTAKKKYRGWRSFAWDDGYTFTAPAASYKTNAFGLYDMIGNVWEWCADWYAKDYYQESAAVDPLGPSNGTHRVVRGGSWLSSPPRCRSAVRTGSEPRGWYCDFIVGFRVVVESSGSRELPPAVTITADTRRQTQR